jgi:predicted DNA-binding transcriptional regulator AlpA
MSSSRAVLAAVAAGQLRLKDVAGLLDVTPQRVRQLIAQEGFPWPVQVIGRSRLWGRADIDAWMGRVKWWSTRWRAPT